MAEERDAWRASANCRGVSTAIFFTEGSHGKRADAHQAEAKAVCAGCIVAAQCLEVGLHEAFGVFGGRNETERRRIRRQRAQVAS